ncbi:MAG: type II secretion system protein [Gemmatimonadaceae bacterium]
MMRRRRGFSVIELLTVLTVLGVLVRIAIPRYSYVRKQATARAAVADVRVIRDAVFNYHQDRGTWPNETGAGQIPSGLQTYLPTGFDFQRSTYQLDYESWAVGSGLGFSVSAPGVVGVGIETTDPDLASELRKLGASGIPFFVAGTKTTFVLAGLEGIS